MAQMNAIEAKARKEYNASAKNGANPIKEKTLNKKLLALYPGNAAEIPEIAARIISEGDAARLQVQASPEPGVVSAGGVPLAVEPTSAHAPEPAPAPEVAQDSEKLSKAAAKRAKKAEKALERLQQQEAQQTPDSSTPIATPSRSATPAPEPTQNAEKLSKAAAKRAKKAEKALQQSQTQDSTPLESPALQPETAQNAENPSKAAAKRAKKAEKALKKMQQQEQEGAQQSQSSAPIFTPTESPAPEQETSGNLVPSKGAMKRAKKAEKALQKLEQQQQEGARAATETSTPVLVPGSSADPTTTETPTMSKGAAKRARKAERALQKSLEQQDGNNQLNSAPVTFDFNGAQSADPGATFTFGNTLVDQTLGAPEKAEKKAKPSKEKKPKKDKKKQAQNGKMFQNGDVLDWAEDADTPEIIRKAPANSKLQELKAYMGAPNGNGHKHTNGSISKTSVLDRQMELLGLDDTAHESEAHAASDTQEAVLFSADLLDRAPDRVAPQYALLGSSVPNPDSTIDRSGRRMFLNTNIPFSAFICGVQGSGKSHTTSCLIEDCMIQSSSLGVLKKPLSTLVLHLGEHSSSLNLRPSEAAFLSSPGRGMLDDYSRVSVTVLASPSNYPNLKALYSQMPNVEVRPFMLQPKHLNVGTMMALMSVDKTQSAPLYMGQVTKILRDMASRSTGDFDYLDFRRRLERSNLDGRQIEFLNQRLDLLESFLDLKGKVKEPNFEAGKVTIIDLSCPFVDSNTACVLFNIGLGMFLQSDLSAGKAIVVDEAHKYMTDTPAAKQLTETLLAIIRQQRHYGVRVIISTQEPTINPRLIDLCSVTVIHRFYSPEWFNALRKHIAPAPNSRRRGRSGRPQSNGLEGGESDDAGDGPDDETAMELFRNISGLRTGEALVFAPSAILGIEESGKARKAETLFKMKMRKRVTWDGGKSMVCV